jgi:hypothetical protein
VRPDKSAITSEKDHISMRATRKQRVSFFKNRALRAAKKAKFRAPPASKQRANIPILAAFRAVFGAAAPDVMAFERPFGALFATFTFLFFIFISTYYNRFRQLFSRFSTQLICAFAI